MRNARIEAYYNSETYPAKDFGYDDEKRLQYHFGDKRIKLRWHPASQKVNVWYDSLNDLYSIFAIDPPYDIWKAIKNLERRQRKARDLVKKYEQMLENQAKADQDEIDAISDPIAGAIKSKLRGRVTVTR